MEFLDETHSVKRSSVRYRAAAAAKIHNHFFTNTVKSTLSHVGRQFQKD